MANDYGYGVKAPDGWAFESGSDGRPELISEHVLFRVWIDDDDRVLWRGIIGTLTSAANRAILDAHDAWEAQRLKSCPFCGGEGNALVDHGAHHIECLGCGARSSGWDISGKARVEWNRRV